MNMKKHPREVCSAKMCLWQNEQMSTGTPSRAIALDIKLMCAGKEHIQG